MRIRSFGALALLCALIIPISANRATAQSSEKPTQYTYVSEWGVPRAMWGDYLKGEAADIDLMKKGIADGTITGFGSFAVLTHQVDGMTHGTWFQATSIANLLKFLEVLRNAPGATDAPLAAAKHADFILQSRDYAGHSGTFTNGILRVGHWAPRPGASDADGKILKATMVPMLDKLLADGALHSYTIDSEAIHTAPLGTSLHRYRCERSRGHRQVRRRDRSRGKEQSRRMGCSSGNIRSKGTLRLSRESRRDEPQIALGSAASRSFHLRSTPL